MITRNEFHTRGINVDQVKDTLDLLSDHALTTNEIATALSSKLPTGSKKITYSAAKQRLLRYEKRNLVERKKVDGLTYWSKKELNE